MDNKSLVISRLEKEPLFALGFVVDNNPEGVKFVLESNGIKPPVFASTRDLKIWEFNTLKDLLNTNKSLVISMLTGVKYNKEADNYTAGYNDYFMSKEPAKDVTANSRLDVTALFSGLGAGLMAYGATSQQNQFAQSGAGYKTPAQIEADRLAAEKAAAEKRTRNTIFGIIAAIVVITVLVVVLKPEKKSS